MKSENIRNVVLVGHSGAGKTSLAEALLHLAGVTSRRGRVEDGNTFTDFEPEEIERQLSLGLSLAPFDWKGVKINLIDTPGYADFIGEARAALRVADLAVFVVSAVDGVEVQTEVLWRMAEEEGTARAVFVNKLDRERASFDETLAAVIDSMGRRVAPFLIPIGQEAGLTGVVDVATSRAFTYPDGGAGTLTEVPEDVRQRLATLHENMVEAVVETDDDLLEEYLETGEEPDAERLVGAMHTGLVSGTTYPLLCGSAETGIGVDLLADFIVKYGPSPLERPLPPLEAGEVAGTADGHVAAYVFKTFTDPYVGKIALFRVYSGGFQLDDELETSGGDRARMHNLFTVAGSDHHDTKEVVAGDIAGVAKLDGVVSGDTLRTPGSDIRFRPVPVARPCMAVAVFPRTQQDEEKLSTALARIDADDPTLSIERRSDTKETLLWGQGDTHLEISLQRLARRFGVDTDARSPTVPYRETIAGAGQAEGKHKKQSGGRGQFGVAFVRFEPLPRGGGYEFVDEVKGGSIPRQFIPAVDKGVQEALERGLVAGFPVVDVRATVYDGKYHSVDSDELSFKMAGIQAVRSAVDQLRPTMLEPIVKVKVTVDDAYTGDVIADINSKRGRVSGMDSVGNLRIINAEVPQAEMQRYAIDLRSITGGRGVFEMEFDHYEEMPPNEAQKVIAAVSAAAQEEG